MNFKEKWSGGRCTHCKRELPLEAAAAYRGDGPTWARCDQCALLDALEMTSPRNVAPGLTVADVATREVLVRCRYCGSSPGVPCIDMAMDDRDRYRVMHRRPHAVRVEDYGTYRGFVFRRVELEDQHVTEPWPPELWQLRHFIRELRGTKRARAAAC